MMKLKGKTAIVTGAGSGIGRAIAVRLAAEGGRIAALDLDPERNQQTADMIRSSGGTAMDIPVDVTKSEDIKAAVTRVLADFRNIDILVNCAGGGFGNYSLFKDTPEDFWKLIINLNLNGTLLCTHVVLHHMIGRKYGKIINIGSIAAQTGIPGLAVYSATKGGVASFTKALAMELGPYRINVNCVSPGLISKTTDSQPSKGTFLERNGAPSEVASLVAFLASDEASYITGADYLVDGGRVLGPRGA